MPSTPDPGPSRCLFGVPDESALAKIAATLVTVLPDHACITLEGDLGAGKTTFVKAIAAAVGIEPAEVVSPTFGLIHIHDGPARARGGLPVRIVHADMYRLSGDAELRETGWEDAIAGQPGTRIWTFLEWPSRIAAVLPADRLDIAIHIDSETARTLEFSSPAAAYRHVIAALAERAPPVPPRSHS